jgi:succinate-semialdehyde dehydrogenase/glutarate-semialdehyde dehydrogenase
MAYAVTDPATGEVVKEYEAISDADLEAATGRAHQAHAPWARGRSLSERAAIVDRVGDLHEERAEQLAEVVAREMGKPVSSAVGEIKLAGAIYKYYAANAESLLADKPLEVTSGPGEGFIRHASIGVVLGIMPWNYPYYQVARFAAPNLVIGNTILLKHASQCPESAAAMEAIIHEAGVPADAYINVYATSSQLSSVIADPRVRGVSLTGSEAAGAAVAEQAGRHLKKVVLELGGSDPFIVLASDDLDTVVQAAVSARMSNAGQSCNGAKRFIVMDDLYDEFLEKFTEAMAAMQHGDPTDPNTKFGPLSSSAAAEFLEEQVERAVAEGATIAVGGERQGSFFPATVLTDISEGNTARHEEFFGPVAQVYRVSSEEEAIEVANDTPFGLGSYIFSSDPEQANRVADQIDAGMAFINTVGGGGPEVPFGGVKSSGFGRELGPLGIEEFVNKKLYFTRP